MGKKRKSTHLGEIAYSLGGGEGDLVTEESSALNVKTNCAVSVVPAVLSGTISIRFIAAYCFINSMP